jgi:hypothetical protein
MLQAADEVLWSCYRPFSWHRDRRCSGTAALRRADLHADGHRPDGPGQVAKAKANGPLEGYFQTLPVAILQLPPHGRHAPWALALIGHEVGHFSSPAPAGSAFDTAFRKPWWRPSWSRGRW